MGKPKDGGKGLWSITRKRNESIHIRNGKPIQNVAFGIKDAPPTAGNTVWGTYSRIELETTKIVPAAREMFTSRELAARIATHAARVQAELTRQDDENAAATKKIRRKERKRKRSATAKPPKKETPTMGPTDEGNENGELEKYPPTLKLLNCRRCRKELLARGQHQEPHYPEFVAGRAFGIPYCSVCLPHAREEALPPQNRFCACPSMEG